MTKKNLQIKSLINYLEDRNIDISWEEATKIINRKIYLSRTAAHELYQDSQGANVTTKAQQERWQRENDRINKALLKSLDKFNNDYKYLEIKAEIMNGYAKITNLTNQLL